MGLFTSDLYRSFGIGFVLGAVALFVALNGEARTELVGKPIPSAYAAGSK
jgi:hypothetical protein